MGAMGSPAADRYTAVAIVLHWAIAAAILGNLLLGWWMHGAIEVAQTQARAITAFQLHKSLGLTVLVLSLLRLAWRWRRPPPPLPAAVPRWEQWTARLTHWAFYALMIGLPLSGWLYVSTQWRGNGPLNVPTLWFGLFEVPHLFGLNQGSRELRQSLAGQTFTAHFYLAWSMAALLVLHVAAALKHHFLNRDAVLAHMVPGLKARDETVAPPSHRGRTAVLIGGFSAIAFAALAVVFGLFKAPSAAGAAGASRITSAPGAWAIDPERSEIAFSGVHAGVPFRGRFTRWHADLRFDPAAPAGSSIDATIETGSATDGVPLHDETLPEAEWFDVANHPHAAFRTMRIVPRDGGGYDVAGVLTIKGRDLPVPPLVLTVEGDALHITGRFEVDRGDADLGMESDPAAEYVSRKIEIEVKVRATPPS